MFVNEHMHARTHVLTCNTHGGVCIER